MTNTIKFINDQLALDNLVASLTEDQILSLDTEFERRTTFFPKPALLQIQFGSVSYLMDPLACKQLDDFFKALSKNTLLMHACREDLEVFREMSIQPIQNFFDTQIAASLLGFDAQVSYQNLVYEFLGVELSKSETCSDWLQRPLSQEQIQYAADDVIHLKQINTILIEKLEALNRLDWYQQEMSFLQSLVNAPAEDDYYFKMKGLGRLTQQQLLACYHFILWRDKLAKSKNIPRGFILKDKGLLQIIKLVGQQEITNNLLHRLDDVPAPFIRRYGVELCELLKNAETSVQAQAAIEKLPKDLPDTSKKLKKNLKEFRDGLASQLNLKAEVLLSNRLLDQLFDFLYCRCDVDCSQVQFDSDCTNILNPWRYDLFKTELIALKNIIQK